MGIDQTLSFTLLNTYLLKYLFTMERSDRKADIKERATKYFTKYPEIYKDEKNSMLILDLADKFFDDRNETEVTEDEDLGIDSDDFQKWVNEAFDEWKHPKEEDSNSKGPIGYDD